MGAAMVFGMNTKEKAQDIRNQVKAMGLTRKQVAVKMSPGSAIYVTVHDPLVSLSAVERIAKTHESVRYCESSGEILSGGNTFVFVRYSDDAARQIEQAVKTDGRFDGHSLGVCDGQWPGEFRFIVVDGGLSYCNAYQALEAARAK
jgi:hypothetical protein